MLLLGIHTVKTNNLADDVVNDMEKFKLNCSQIFTINPRSYASKSKIDYDEFRKKTEQYFISVHSSYPMISMFKEFNEKGINEHIYTCEQVGAEFLIIHLLNIKEKDVIKNCIKRMLSKIKKCKLLIEMTATKKNTWVFPDKLNELTEYLDLNEQEKNNFGWCIDTSHLHGAGYDLSTGDLMKKWFNDFKYKELIRMIHLNGSSTNLGSSKDIHEIPLSDEDVINKGTGNNNYVYEVIKFAKKKKDLRIIIEYNRGTQENLIKCIKKIKKIYKEQ